MTFLHHIAVMGAGAWGTALALVAQRAGRKVSVWAREAEVAEALSAGRGNPVYLPGLALDPIATSTDFNALDGADAVFAVVPAQHARAVFAEAAGHIAPGTPVVLCAKGVEQGSLKLMTEVLAETIPHAAPAVLSGPSFAADVARGLPTAVTLASADRTLGEQLTHAIGRPTFRPYWTDDMIGVETGGAVKNVLAIACGIVEGLGLGKSAHAALIARGFAEMSRLGAALGGRAETLAGLSGLGDLVLTCASPQSRNMSFGAALGAGRTAEAVLAERSAVTEGAASAPAVCALARRHGVEIPICEAVAAILAGARTVDQAMADLLQRPFKAEA
ncbi:MAG: NAD(P)H-dependent glycerol-3-phosphate dehydrogenase [Pseudomonadota bacterium]